MLLKYCGSNTVNRDLGRDCEYKTQKYIKKCSILITNASEKRDWKQVFSNIKILISNQVQVNALTRNSYFYTLVVSINKNTKQESNIKLLS